jgi:hypothetical protein
MTREQVDQFVDIFWTGVVIIMIVFLLGTLVGFINPAAASQWLRAYECGV